ncbi:MULTISPECIES: hypothetical protein [Rheinheimera]|uniref:Bacterial Pleckstrin homology domain-containing protein n=1 Tax=Rheinheimera marina TaxID=1774958 RepID=A0ABV9JQ88_9GAMM
MYIFDLGWQLYLCLISALLLVPALVLFLLYWVFPQSLRACLWGMALCCLLFLGLCLKLNDNRVAMSVDALEITAGLFQTRVEHIHAANSKIDLRFCDELAEFEPVELVSGLNLPGYKVGWYKLANQQQAFVMLIGEIDRVSVVRTDAEIALIGGDINQQGINARAQIRAFLL